MSEELFSVQEQLSPRLAWMKKYGMKSHYYKNPSDACGYAWTVWPGDLMTFTDAIKKRKVSHGSTEDDALTAWAKRNGVKLWNEEGASPKV